MIDRRAFLGILGLIGVPPASGAQPGVKVPRVGFLSDSRQPWDEAFRKGLRELG